jgi:malonate decarboxylase epsilon subunit
MTLALVFPGQGAQSAGFLHRLPEHEAVRATLDEASATLGIDVTTLDSADALRSTVAVQVALTVAGVAIARAVRDSMPDSTRGCPSALTRQP